MPSAPHSREPQFTDLAISDLDEIEYYISRDSPVAARRLVRRLREMCSTLAEQPFMGRACPELAPDIRSFVVDNYIILYRPVASTVEITRIVQGSRNLRRLFEQ